MTTETINRTYAGMLAVHTDMLGLRHLLLTNDDIPGCADKLL
jgi:hypothetical protein